MSMEQSDGFEVRFADEQGLEALVAFAQVTLPARVRLAQRISDLVRSADTDLAKGMNVDPVKGLHIVSGVKLASPGNIHKVVLGEALMPEPLANAVVYLDPARSGFTNELFGYSLKADLTPAEGKTLPSIGTAPFKQAFKIKPGLSSRDFFLDSDSLPRYNRISVNVNWPSDQYGIRLDADLFNQAARSSASDAEYQQDKSLAGLFGAGAVLQRVSDSLNSRPMLPREEIDKMEADIKRTPVHRILLEDEALRGVVTEFMKATQIAVNAVYRSAGLTPPNQTLYLGVGTGSASAALRGQER